MPLSRSFLGRVTKYVPTEGLDPAENRLTEVTAGVLEHVEGFAAELVESMLDFAVKDLEMRAKVAAHDLVFWIEVKHGAPVHGDQLEAYEREVPANGVVLVVAPLQSMPDDVPTPMPIVPWQRLAGVVRGRRRRAGVGTSEYFILDAYAAYLREEDLMADALTTSHALALEHHPGAEQVLSDLCRLADSNVEDRWGTREDQHSPYGQVKYGQRWWAIYPMQRHGCHRRERRLGQRPSHRWLHRLRKRSLPARAGLPLPRAAPRGDHARRPGPLPRGLGRREVRDADLRSTAELAAAARTTVGLRAPSGRSPISWLGCRHRGDRASS